LKNQDRDTQYSAIFWKKVKECVLNILNTKSSNFLSSSPLALIETNLLIAARSHIKEEPMLLSKIIHLHSVNTGLAKTIIEVVLEYVVWDIRDDRR
jgi:hypothetical protein